MESPPKGRGRVRIWVLVTCLVLLAGFACFWGLPQFCMSRARQAISARELDRAEVWLNRAEQLGGAPAQIVLARARVARLNGDGRETATYLERAVRMGVERGWVDLEWMFADAQAGDIDSLSKQFLMICEQQPEEADEACWALASGMISLRSFDQADALLAAWQESDPSDAKPWFLWGESLRERQKFEECLTAYRRAAELQPGWWEPRLAEANVLESMRQHADALAVYQSIPEQGPQQIEVIYGKASVYNSLGQYEDAENTLKHLLQDHPDHYASLVLLGQLHQINDNWEGVVEVLQPLREKYPEDMEINQQLAQAYARLDQPEKSMACEEQYKQSQAAIADFERRKALIPQHANESNYYSELAQIILPHRYHEAEPLLYTAVALDPMNKQAYQMLSEVAQRRGDRKKVEYFRYLAQRTAKASAPAVLPKPDAASPPESKQTPEGAQAPAASQAPAATQAPDSIQPTGSTPPATATEAQK